MFYFVLAIVLFNAGLAVALYKRPKPNRLSRLVEQMDKEKLARYHRNQADFFNANMRD